MPYPIGKNIRTLRKELHITQAQLAELCNVEPSNISHWENDRWQPNVSHLTVLAEALGVSVEELCGIPLDEEKKVKTRLQNLMLVEAEDLTIPEQEHVINVIKGLKVVRRLNSEQKSITRFPECFITLRLNCLYFCIKWYSVRRENSNFPIRGIEFTYR